jgi:hypothetical protein
VIETAPRVQARTVRRAMRYRVMDDTLTGGQRATLRALCDTIVPRVERADDPHGFWARRASDLGIERFVEGYLATLRPDQFRGLQMLLAGLEMQNFADAPSDPSREHILAATALSSPAAGAQVAHPHVHVWGWRSRDRA